MKNNETSYEVELLKGKVVVGEGIVFVSTKNIVFHLWDSLTFTHSLPLTSVKVTKYKLVRKEKTNG